MGDNLGIETVNNQKVSEVSPDDDLVYERCNNQHLSSNHTIDIPEKTFKDFREAGSDYSNSKLDKDKLKDLFKQGEKGKFHFSSIHHISEFWQKLPL